MTTNSLIDESVLIRKAASRVRGDRLSKLLAICEKQKTISTRKLMRHVRELEAIDRLDGLHFKALADFVRKQRAKEKA